MSWIERIKSNITPTRKASIPEGVWTKCDSCGQVLYRAELERNLEVCPKCDHHMRMSARNRLHSLLDEGSMVELGSELEPKDVLKFRDSKKYKDRLASAQKETGEKDALAVLLMSTFEASFFAYRTMIFIVLILVAFNLLRWLHDSTHSDVSTSYFEQIFM